MKPRLPLVVVAALAWWWCAPAVALPPSLQSVPAAAAGRSALPTTAAPAAQLLAELRQGGYILYFRHTSTDFSRDDARSQNDDDCENQRPLTDKGRAEARAIGSAIREHPAGSG